MPASISTLIWLLGLAAAFPALAEIAFVAEPASRLWIVGRSNISTFECEAGAYEIHASTNRSARLFPTVSRAEAAFTATIRAADLACGRTRMDDDLHSALQADRYPHIRFALDSAYVESSSDIPYGLHITGQLTIAGTTRTVEYTAKGFTLPDDKVRATGHAAIRLTDYNIEPPSRLFGLVRVSDRLAVHFDLLLSPDY